MEINTLAILKNDCAIFLPSLLSGEDVRLIDRIYGAIKNKGRLATWSQFPD